MISKILEISKETHDVKTFKITKPEGFIFQPGQHISINIPGTDLIRPFTITSTPSQNYLLLTIKKVGQGTSILFDLKKDDEININGPYQGKYTFKDSDKKLLYIAGGTGITPFISHFRYMKEKKLNYEIILLYANKTKEDIIFLDELKNYDNLKLVNILSRDDAGDEKGYISKEIIEKYVENIQDFKILICGPPRFEELVESII